MKKQFAHKKLSYTCSVEPLLAVSDEDLSGDLKVTYRGEELPTPVLLTLIIRNTGLTAIEHANVVVKLPGSTYLIPGYFVGVPPGYSLLWQIERTDAEECTIRFTHINPGQRAIVKLLADELPQGEPMLSCPMPNVQLLREGQTLGLIARVIVEVVAPDLLQVRDNR